MHEFKRNELESKIRVAAVSYLNTKPLIYGFEKGMMADEVELLKDYPSSIAQMLKDDEVDVALLPVALLPELKEHYIITDYCIGSEGEVASVCLFSDVPLKEIKTILLDYQSRSSVGLLKILLKDFWQINVELIPSFPGYEEGINGTTAGLVIGDRAFIQRKKRKFIYDLGNTWKEMTGLPFLFAAWIANKKLSEKFVQKFNDATAEGFKHLPEIIEAASYPYYDLNVYYNKNISFTLDKEKIKGLNEYLKRLNFITNI